MDDAAKKLIRDNDEQTSLSYFLEKPPECTGVCRTLTPVRSTDPDGGYQYVCYTCCGIATIKRIDIRLKFPH